MSSLRSIIGVARSDETCMRSWEPCQLCPGRERVSYTTTPGPMEPARNYHRFNSTALFVLHILVSNLSWMVPGPDYIDVVERYFCICNAKYIIP